MKRNIKKVKLVNEDTFITQIIKKDKHTLKAASPDVFFFTRTYFPGELKGVTYDTTNMKYVLVLKITDIMSKRIPLTEEEHTAYVEKKIEPNDLLAITMYRAVLDICLE